MGKINITLFFILFLITAFRSVTTFEAYQPKQFPKPEYDFTKNPLSKNKIQLGRILFYDPLLSKDNSISCASCHSPYNAFAHTDHALSHGINDQIGKRNAPALQNLAWQNSFMYDGAIVHLDMQSLFPISHPKEMNESIEHVVEKLNKNVLYKKLFYQAFADSNATGEFVLKAISQFMLTLISANAKYDSVMMGKAKFTMQEKNGYTLFQKNCNSCHAAPLFSKPNFANNGLAMDTFLKDVGRFTVSRINADSLHFKIPSLRNIEHTAPYMHDGRFKRLMQVMNHYTNEVQQSRLLSPQLKQPIVLTENEKVDLIAFLLTLSDDKFVRSKTHGYKGLE
jgi:cytochrome c peroxidase